MPDLSYPQLMPGGARFIFLDPTLPKGVNGNVAGGMGTRHSFSPDSPRKSIAARIQKDGGPRLAMYHIQAWVWACREYRVACRPGVQDVQI